MSRFESAAETVLIASSSVDRAVWLPVAERLDEWGCNVLAYEADKVAKGKIPLNISVGQAAGLAVEYAGQPRRLDQIGAAWYRRPNMFADTQDDQTDTDRARQLSLTTQRQLAQYVLWNVVPERAWLNSPDNIRRADHKLSQLILARELGFNIPSTTLVTNNWTAVTESLPQNIICKPFHPLHHTDSDLKVAFTSPFENDIAKLPIDSIPFPGIWQPQLGKTREWRVTVVGSDTFDAAIYTRGEAKTDWRAYQDGSDVVFRREPFPDNQKLLCLEYLSRLSLKFGCFDFTEDDNGITFLECNPNGQYGWLERKLGLPISNAIASELLKIARSGLY